MQVEHTRKAYPRHEARAMLGNMSNTTFHKFVGAGELRVIKLGRKTLVSAEEIDRFIAVKSGKAA